MGASSARGRLAALVAARLPSAARFIPSLRKLLESHSHVHHSPAAPPCTLFSKRIDAGGGGYVLQMLKFPCRLNVVGVCHCRREPLLAAAHSHTAPDKAWNPPRTPPPSAHTPTTVPAPSMRARAIHAYPPLAFLPGPPTPLAHTALTRPSATPPGHGRTVSTDHLLPQPVRRDWGHPGLRPGASHFPLSAFRLWLPLPRQALSTHPCETPHLRHTRPTWPPASPRLPTPAASSSTTTFDSSSSML